MNSIAKESNMKNLIMKKKGQFITILLLISVKIVLSSSMALILKQMIDILTYGNYREFCRFIFVAIVYFILSVVITVESTILNLSFFKYIGCSIRKGVFRNIIIKSVIEFREKKIGDFISRLNNEINIVESDCIANVLTIYADILSIIVACVLIFSINVKFAAVMLAIALLLLLTVTQLSNRAIKPRNKCIECMRNYNGKVKEYLTGYEVIKNFGIENPISVKFNKEVDLLENSIYQYGKVQASFEIISGYMNFAIMFLVIILGGFMTFRSVISIGSLIAIVQLLNGIISPVSDLSVRITKLKASRDVAKNLFESLTKEKEDTSEEKEVISSEIAFRDVVFSYDGNRNVIDHVSMVLEKGKKYSILGPSGSGKSTLYKLICQEYTNYLGDITIDGVEVRKLNQKSFHKMFSIVNQEVFLFNETLRENLILEREIPDAKIMEVTSLLGLQEMIEKRGMDYLINEDGNNLSGGEKCRIAIARSLLQDKQILILDEAFSSLDRIVADKIESDILNIDNLTVINITHKINEKILERYDEIVMIDKGKIEEKGKYHELMLEQNLLFKFCRN
ncbi:ABC transporter ATP-binding protein [Lachnotalea glycerini]|uniref:ABC transporter ATP-binding protein n=2 Tax=Lachnotalea glycerini TaxID=1763509 RepID=A0A371JBG9_9FIRM|nr:ABC transporter ATP-binding protein [Lachnotalea glycerini]